MFVRPAASARLLPLDRCPYQLLVLEDEASDGDWFQVKMGKRVELKADRDAPFVNLESNHPFPDSVGCFWPAVIVMVNPAGVIDRDSVFAIVSRHWRTGDDDHVSRVARLLRRCFQ
jgi:hypothetical protein